MNKIMNYRIKINNQEVKAEEIRVSAMPFNRVWPGYQRDINQSEIAYMVRVTENSPIDVEIAPSLKFDKVEIRPLSKKIEHTNDGKKIKFSIQEHGQYTIEFDGEHNAIHLFFDKVRDFSEYPTATYFFGAGEHNAGLIKLKSGDRVYIDKDAIVHGSIYGVDVSDIKIYGYGVLNGDWENRTEKHGDIGWDNENIFAPEMVHTYGGIRFYRCNDIVIDGITVCDPASYAISMFHCDDIAVKNSKVTGLWKYNTDGIDFFNCRNVNVKKCFVRSFDDSLCLKGITAFSDKNVENVLVEDCVFWCSWGLTCEIGVASACEEIKNVIFRNCDLIHNCNVCLDISDGQWAYVHNVKYENINIEYSNSCRMPVIQRSDEQVYEESAEVKVPFLARIYDQRRGWQGNKAEDDPRCRISDILYKNIRIITEDNFTKTPEIYVKKCMSCSNFSNISFEDIYINDEKITDLSRFGENVEAEVVLR